MGHQRVGETWRILLALFLATSAAAALQARPFGRVTSDGSLDPPDGAFDVERLPGWDAPLPSRHRAGYVTVSPPRRLYYYLVGSESATPESDPLILWLSGGPGCSSLDAFVYEHGPFKFSLAPRKGGSSSGGSGGPSSADDVTLSRNPHAWSRLGHVLYVDSPAGTGMSYSTDPEDRYRTDDHATVEGLLQLVLGVLRDVPDMRGRDVYLAGESYAGVYVPLLAQRIVQHNKETAFQQHQQQRQEQSASTLKPATTRRRLLTAAPPPSSGGGGADGSSGGGGGWRRRRVRLAGYLVGNGVTDDRVDGDSQVPYAFGAGLLDAATHTFVAAACNGSYWDARRGGRCWDALELADAAVGPVNPYDVGAPCFFPRAGAAGGAADARAWPLAPRFEAGGPVGNWWSGAAAAAGGKTQTPDGRSSSGGGGGKKKTKRLGHVVPCADRRAALAYWNDPEVRRAVHAAPAKAAGRWEPCSDVLHYTHTAPSMVGVHRHLLEAGVRALVYSGLSDYVVPFTGTREWTAALGLPIEFPWRPWKLGRQVAGHAVRYRATPPAGDAAAAAGGSGDEQAAAAAAAAENEGLEGKGGGGRWPGGDGGGALTFATVIGAGHMVPQSRPEAALELLRAWLAREL